MLVPGQHWAVVEDGPLESRLRRHRRAPGDFTRREPEKVAIVRVAATMVGSQLGRRVERLLAQRREHDAARMTALLAAGIAGGEIDAGHISAEELCLAWSAFLDRLLSSLIFFQDEPDPFQEHFETVWALLWRGLSGCWPEVVETIDNASLPTQHPVEEAP